MLDETSFVDKQRCHMAARFCVFVDEDHSKLPMLYWFPKLQKRTYKSSFIAISSSCTTTDVYTYDITVSKRNGKHLFWSIKHSGEILINSSLMVF